MRPSLAAILLFLAGCDRALDRPIHFVLPTGYSGPFVMVADAAYPDAIVKKPGRYEISVPADGVVRTKSVRIFQRWHKLTAAYDDGAPLPRWESKDNQLHSGPTSYEGDDRSLSLYYVGQYEEYKQFMYGNHRMLDRWLDEHALKH